MPESQLDQIVTSLLTGADVERRVVVGPVEEGRLTLAAGDRPNACRHYSLQCGSEYAARVLRNRLLVALAAEGGVLDAPPDHPDERRSWLMIHDAEDRRDFAYWVEALWPSVETRAMRRAVDPDAPSEAIYWTATLIDMLGEIFPPGSAFDSSSIAAELPDYPELLAAMARLGVRPVHTGHRKGLPHRADYRRITRWLDGAVGSSSDGLLLERDPQGWYRFRRLTTDELNELF